MDELIGKQEVVIKSLGGALKKNPALAGGAVLGDGRVGLIQNVDALVKLNHALPLAAQSPARPAPFSRTSATQSNLWLPQPSKPPAPPTNSPDKTESASTVDAGHFQIEMDLLTYERDHDTAGGANTQTESWGIAPINLKVGLRNRTDLQVVLATYGSVRTRDRVGR